MIEWKEWIGEKLPDRDYLILVSGEIMTAEPYVYKTPKEEPRQCWAKKDNVVVFNVKYYAEINLPGGEPMGLLYDREFTELEKSQMITTGQMIDTLKHGEIAECMNGFYEGSKVYRTDHDEIIFTDSKDFLKMTTFSHSSKWIMYNTRRE